MRVTAFACGSIEGVETLARAAPGGNLRVGLISLRRLGILAGRSATFGSDEPAVTLPPDLSDSSRLLGPRVDRRPAVVREPGCGHDQVAGEPPHVGGGVEFELQTWAICGHCSSRELETEE